MRLFAAFGVVGALAMSAVAAPPTVMVNTDNGVPFVSNRPLTGFATTGALMTGMKVRVDYTDGTNSQATWGTTGTDNGAAQGPDWRSSINGDTFTQSWTFANQGQKAIRRVTFDALPGDTVVDLTFGGAEGTPGSARGNTFNLASGPDDLNIIATYRNAVGINNSLPVGDIFSHLVIDFTNTGGLPAGTSIVYFADTDNLRFGGEDPDGDCCWENGGPIIELSQASHEGGALPHGMKVADDFYLCEGQIHRLDSITATVLTNTLPFLTKARAELYADCDGRPGQLLYTFTDFVPTEGPALPSLPGYRQVEFQFTPSSQSNPDLRAIYLRGGTYWLSIIGISPNLCEQGGDPTLCDITYWATTNDRVKGSVPVKTAGLPHAHGTPFNYSGPWLSISDCCIGCRDMSFSVCTTDCKILHNNGDPTIIGGSAGAISTTSLSPEFDTRAADDFVAPPCTNLAICYVEACVFTNCFPVNGRMDIYANDCHTPGALLFSFPASRAVPINGPGGQTTVDGQTLFRYRLEFHQPGFVLAPGQQYWISFSVQENGASLTRTIWCYGAECHRTCQTFWNRAVSIRQFGQATGQIPPDSVGVSPWTPLAGDLSFLIAASEVDPTPPGGGGVGPASCPSDFNADGSNDVMDIFSFLQAWFAGCP